MRPTSGDSSTVEPSVELLDRVDELRQDCLMLSAPVSGAPQVVKLERHSRVGPDGDDKDVEVIDVILVAEDDTTFTVRNLSRAHPLPKERRPNDGGWLLGRRRA